MPFLICAFGVPLGVTGGGQIGVVMPVHRTQLGGAPEVVDTFGIAGIQIHLPEAVFERCIVTIKAQNPTTLRAACKRSGRSRLDDCHCQKHARGYCREHEEKRQSVFLEHRSCKAGGKPMHRIVTNQTNGASPFRARTRPEMRIYSNLASCPGFSTSHA